MASSKAWCAAGGAALCVAAISTSIAGSSPGDCVSGGVIDVTCEQWGANPADDGADDWPALQAAIDYARANELAVRIPRGVYRVSATLDVTAVSVRGVRDAGVESGTVIRANGAMWPQRTAEPAECDQFTIQSDSLLWAGGSAFSLEDITIDASGAPFGLFTCRTHRSATKVRHVTVTRASYAGFYFDVSQTMRAVGLLARDGERYGVVARDANGSVFERITAENNSLSGLVVRQLRQHASGGAYFSYILMESNGSAAPDSAPWAGAQVRIIGVTAPTTLEKLWLELSSADGISIESSNHVYLRDAYVKGHRDPRFTTPSHGVRLLSANSCVLDSVVFAREVGGTDIKWATEVKLHPYGWGNTFTNLRYRSSGAVPDPQRITVSRSSSESVNNIEPGMTFGRYAPPAGFPSISRKGDMVWNSEPSAGSPAGWVCAQDADGDPDPNVTRRECSQWLPMADLQ